jgi:putative ABC transport system substrate-binding protein
MNRRRKLLVALGASALTVPFTSFAQPQGKVWRVGILSTSDRLASTISSLHSAFLQGMRELGYAEGKNLVIEPRFAESKAELLPILAAELVQLRVDVILAAATPATGAAQKATTTMPIVMVNVGDPVNSGFVKSLAHPGGNITGISTISSDLGPKRLEMLLSVVPKLSRVAVLLNPSNASNINNFDMLEAAGQKRGVKIVRAEARTPQEIDSAFSLMRQQNAGALIVLLNPIFQNQINLIAELTEKHRLPSMTGDRLYVEGGCLMSYESSLSYGWLRAATYVDKIFKGVKPADLPVEQPMKFELVINGRTAKALGLTIPQSLLISADKVIE